MREYSQTEKEIIEVVSKIDLSNDKKFERVMSDNIAYFKDHCVIIYPKEKRVYLRHDPNLGTKPINEFFQILLFIEEMSERRYLLKVYEPINQEGFIFIGSESLKTRLNLSELDSVAVAERKMKSGGFCFFDLGQFYDRICNNFIGLAVSAKCTEDLVKRKYKTQEQINHEREMFWTRLSFGIAVVALLVATIVPLFCETKISEKQIEKITQAISSLKQANF